MIGRVHFRTTRIPHPGSDHALGGPELGLGEPKSGHTESGLFGGHAWIREGHGRRPELSYLEEKEKWIYEKIGTNQMQQIADTVQNGL